MAGESSAYEHLGLIASMAIDPCGWEVVSPVSWQEVSLMITQTPLRFHPCLDLMTHCRDLRDEPEFGGWWEPASSGSCAVYPSWKTCLKCTSLDLPLERGAPLVSGAVYWHLSFAARTLQRSIWVIHLYGSLMWHMCMCFLTLPSLRWVSPLKFVFNFNTIIISHEPPQAGALWKLVDEF